MNEIREQNVTDRGELVDDSRGDDAGQPHDQRHAEALLYYKINIFDRKSGFLNRKSLWHLTI